MRANLKAEKGDGDANDHFLLFLVLYDVNSSKVCVPAVKRHCT